MINAIIEGTHAKHSLFVLFLVTCCADDYIRRLQNSVFTVIVRVTNAFTVTSMPIDITRCAKCGISFRQLTSWHYYATDASGKKHLQGYYCKPCHPGINGYRTDECSDASDSESDDDAG